MLDVTVFSCGSVVFLVVVPVVGWEPHSGRVAFDLHPPRVSPGVVGWSVREGGFHPVARGVPSRGPRSRPWWGWVCGVSYRLISTGQLHRSLVPASTSGLSTQWSGWGPLTL